MAKRKQIFNYLGTYLSSCRFNNGFILTTVVTTGKAMKALGERANLENVSIPVDNINYPDSIMYVLRVQESYIVAYILVDKEKFKTKSFKIDDFVSFIF